MMIVSTISQTKYIFSIINDMAYALNIKVFRVKDKTN